MYVTSWTISHPDNTAKIKERSSSPQWSLIISHWSSFKTYFYLFLLYYTVPGCYLFGSLYTFLFESLQQSSWYWLFYLECIYKHYCIPKAQFLYFFNISRIRCQKKTIPFHPLPLRSNRKSIFVITLCFSFYI